MGEEKVRVSGELSRNTDSGPVLPTTTQDAIKSEPQKATIPAAAYVMWVSLPSPSPQAANVDQQRLDLSQFRCHSLQQMDS